MATAAGTRPARPVPLRSAEFGHLTLEALRTYRRALNAEEGRISYWRRIVQARLDLARAVEEGRPGDIDHLRGLLTDARTGPGRGAVMDVGPVDDLPPLPDLPVLWNRSPVPGDTEGNAQLVAQLASAETQLSAYRAALHRRIAAATTELIARYREEPTLCLAVLPLDPPVRRRTTA